MTKKKSLIFIFLLFIAFNCFSQKDSIRPLGENEFINIEKRNKIIEDYVNQLNSFSYNDDEKIPAFFYEYDFDLINKRGWINRHTAISLRKLIIDKINNIELLEAVLEIKSTLIKKNKNIPKEPKNYEIIIPYQEYSTYKLVKLRLQEILNNKNMGKSASNYPKE